MLNSVVWTDSTDQVHSLLCVVPLDGKSLIDKKLLLSFLPLNVLGTVFLYLAF